MDGRQRHLGCYGTAPHGRGVLVKSASTRDNVHGLGTTNVEEAIEAGVDVQSDGNE